MQGSGDIGIEVERVRLTDTTVGRVRLLSATRLVLVEDGRGSVEVAGRSSSLTVGRLLLIPPATNLNWHPEPSGLALIQVRLRTRCLAPQHPIDREALELLRRCWSWVRRDGPCLGLPGPARRRCSQLLSSLAETSSHLELKAGILALLAELGRALPEGLAGAGLSTAARGIEAAIAHLRATADRPFAIDEVCAIAGLRRSRFDQAFRAATGMPAAGFHRRLRLDRAAERLRNPEADLLTVALACGYSGLSRFYADFTRAFGQPPGRWRRQAARP